MHTPITTEESAIIKTWYPDWVARLANPGLQDLRLSAVGCPTLRMYSRSADWRNSAGHAFFDHLVETSLMTCCLGIRDGQFLINNGFMRGQFAGQSPLLWRSSAYDSSGNLLVPFIQNIPGQTPLIYWWWLDYHLKEIHCTPMLEV